MGIGAVIMRAAGCAINDVIDADLDAKVERTKGRPVASGQISKRNAALFALVLSLLGAVILFQFAPLSVGLGIAALCLVVAYPFMKTITWWPQAWLGLTFNWGALIAYTSSGLSLDAPILWLFCGLAVWTIGYDTLYALQDREDDALIGIKSSARALGNYVPQGVRACYFLSLTSIAIACALAKASLFFYGGWMALAAHLIWQIRRIESFWPQRETHRPELQALALRLFKSNRESGILILVTLWMGMIAF